MPQNKPTATYNPESGGSHMEIEPVDPRQGPIGGPGQPILRDGAIPTPVKPGMPQQGISSEFNAIPGGREHVRPAPYKPGEVTRPKKSDLVKT
jgi:hypothetical protein